MKAVIVGDNVEFQVIDASEFAESGYLAGEARFILHPLPEKNRFLVEDRYRLKPPVGHKFANQDARATCLAIRKHAAGEPLKASLDGDRLDVDLAKYEPSGDNYVIVRRTVHGCKDLDLMTTSRLPTKLTRQ